MKILAQIDPLLYSIGSEEQRKWQEATPISVHLGWLAPEAQQRQQPQQQQPQQRVQQQQQHLLQRDPYAQCLLAKAEQRQWQQQQKAARGLVGGQRQ